MRPLTRLTATAAPFPEDNVDTDIIVPARFLLITEKKGLGRYAFYERRHTADGQDRPDFFLNEPRYAGAQILIAGANFGCGSSREHAPWALADLGFRALIAPSFGDIFAGNCIKNGMLPIAIAEIAPFIADAEAGRPITIDLVARLVERADGTATPFAIDEGAREALLNGWDDIETILGRHGADIAQFEHRQQTTQPWLWTEG
jgi:3-isopropylmalate dehydratase small subunit